MINSLKVNVIGDVKEIDFEVISPIGRCKVRVDLQDLDSHGYPKAFITDYSVLGRKYDKDISISGYKKYEEVMLEGIKRLSEDVRVICKDNHWCLWSY